MVCYLDCFCFAYTLNSTPCLTSVTTLPGLFFAMLSSIPLNTCLVSSDVD